MGEKFVRRGGDAEITQRRDGVEAGIGRDGGDWSFDFYTETVNVCFPRAFHKIPKLGG